ncbi:MAG: hypothetical protein R2784_03925 [Saprospiraceae bacterium]
MAANKVVLVMQTLDKKDLKLLDKFVRSPIYNQHEDVIRLFDYLKNALHDGNGSLSNEAIFSVLFPDQAFEVQKLHYVNSYLLKTIESYFAWKEWQDDEMENSLYLLRAYRNRKIDDQFERTYRQIEKKLFNQPYRNLQHHSLEYRLRIEQIKAESNRRGSDLHLQELSDAQDTWFAVEKLYNASTMISHQAVVKKEYDMGLLYPILDFLEDSKLMEVPAVSLYFHAFKALADLENEKDYRQLKSAIEKYRERFPQSELRSLFLAALNFCIRRNNRGEKEYLRDMFELYQLGLDSEVFLENGILSRWTFRNIVSVAIQLGEYEWTKKFIEEFSDYLAEDHRSGTVNLNLAFYYYSIGDFDNAMPMLMQADHDDILHNLFAKLLQSKMLYELDDYDALESMLQSFKTYIHRKKVIGYHRSNYLNFIKYLQKVMSVNYYDKEKMEKLKGEISGEKNIVEKEWLLQRVESM